MNAIEAQLLQHSMENLGNTFQRNREFDANQAFRQKQLDVENEQAMQRLLLDQQVRQMQEARADAAQKHYDAMEANANARGDAAAAHENRMEAKQDAMNDKLEKQIGLKDHLSKLKDLRDAISQGMAGLSKQVTSGDISDEDATGYLQDSIDSQPEFKDELLQNPVVSSLYNGQGSWRTFGQPPAANVITTPGGGVVVQDAKGNLKPVHTNAPAKGATHTTKVNWDPNSQAYHTNTVDTVTTPSTNAPAMTNNQASPRQLDVTTAAQFLRQAGGDRVKARQMAVDAGYSF